MEPEPSSPPSPAPKAPPTLERIWALCKANLVGLALVVVGFGLTGYVVIHSSTISERKADERTAQEGADRRAGICAAIVDVNPEALTRAFQQDPTDPTVAAALAAYRADLWDALGFCPTPRPVVPPVPATRFQP